MRWTKRPAGVRIPTSSLALLFATLLPVAGHGQVLKLAHFVSPSHVVTPSIIEPLVDGLKEATGGSVSVDVYPGGELGPGPAEQYVRAVNGVADITFGLSGYTSSQFPKSMIVELPGVVEQAGSGHEAVWHAFDEHLTDEFPGTKPLALWTSEPVVLIMKDKEVRVPGDLAGLKIRVSGAVPAKVIEALGATPVQMPAPQMYNALQTGLIDGIMTGASAIRDFKLNEVSSIYVEGPQLGHILFFLVMNQATYDALSDDAQKAIDGVAKGLSESGERGWNQVARNTMDALRADASKTVISLDEKQSASFNEIAFRVRNELIAELDAKGVEATATLNAMLGK